MLGRVRRASAVLTRCPFRPALRFAALSLALAAQGCGAGEKEPVVLSPRPPAPPAAPPAGAPAPVEPPPESDAPAPDPEAARMFLARAAQGGAAGARPAEPPKVTALALANTARGEAQGMEPRGPVQGFALAEGESGAVPVRLEPGECATFIAQGGLGVIEVDLFLTRGAGTAMGILAQDTDRGPIAVIGGRGACFPNPGSAPLLVELHAQVRRGAGVVLVQGYRRASSAPRDQPPR